MTISCSTYRGLHFQCGYPTRNRASRAVWLTSKVSEFHPDLCLSAWNFRKPSFLFQFNNPVAIGALSRDRFSGSWPERRDHRETHERCRRRESGWQNLQNLQRLRQKREAYEEGRILALGWVLGPPERCLERGDCVKGVKTPFLKPGRRCWWRCSEPWSDLRIRMLPFSVRTADKWLFTSFRSIKHYKRASPGACQRHWRLQQRSEVLRKWFSVLSSFPTAEAGTVGEATLFGRSVEKKMKI